MIFIGNPPLYGSMAISNFWFFFQSNQLKNENKNKQINTWNHTAIVCNALLPLITIKKTISAYNGCYCCWNQAKWLEMCEKMKKHSNDCERKRQSIEIIEKKQQNQSHTRAHTHRHTQNPHSISLLSLTQTHRAHSLQFPKRKIILRLSF